MNLLAELRDLHGPQARKPRMEWSRQDAPKRFEKKSKEESNDEGKLNQ